MHPIIASRCKYVCMYVCFWFTGLPLTLEKLFKQEQDPNEEKNSSQHGVYWIDFHMKKTTEMQDTKRLTAFKKAGKQN